MVENIKFSSNDIDVDIVIKYFLLKRFFTSVREIKESETTKEILKKINSLPWQYDKNRNCYVYQVSNVDNIEVLWDKSKSTDAEDTEALTFILRFREIENTLSLKNLLLKVQKFLENAYNIIFGQDQNSPFYKIVSIKENYKSQDYFISNPYIILSVGYKKNTNLPEEFKQLVPKYYFSIFNKENGTESEKIFNLKVEQNSRKFNGKPKESKTSDTVFIYSQTQKSGYRLLFYTSYSADVDYAVSFFIFKKLPLIYLSFLKLKFELNQYELYKLRYSNKNLVTEAFNTLNKHLDKLEENKRYFFQITDKDISELGLKYKRVSEYVSMSRGYYITIKRHYAVLNSELNSEAVYQGAKISIIVDKTSQWFDMINLDLGFETKVKNLEAYIGYINSDFEHLTAEYNYFNQLLHFYSLTPPDLIITTNTNAEAIFMSIKNVNFISVKTNEEASSKEKIINAFFQSFLNKKECAITVIKTISQAFTNYIQKKDVNNTDRKEMDGFSFINDSPDIKINNSLENKELQNEYKLVIKSLEKIYFSDLEECREIKNATMKEMPDILFISALNSTAVNLYEISLKEYQQNKEFDKIERILNLELTQAKDDKKGAKIFHYYINSVKKILQRFLRINVRQQHINNSAIQKSEHRADYSAEIINLKLKKFAFNYYMDRYDVYNAVQLIKNELHGLFIINLIGYLWNDKSKIVTSFIVIVIISLLLSPMYGFKDFPAVLRNISVKVNIAIALFVFLVVVLLILDAFKYIVAVLIRRNKDSIESKAKLKFNSSRIFLPRLIGAIFVGGFGGIMADIDWTIINNLKNTPIYYYAWVLAALIGSLLYFYFRIAKFYNSIGKIFKKSITVLSAGIIYSYLFSMIFVDLVVPLRFGKSELLQLKTDYRLSNFIFSKVVNLVSHIYFPYYLLFFASIALFLGTALQLLWSEKQVTEEL